MSPDETTELIRSAKAGTPGAFDLLHRRYAGKLLALVRLRLGRELRSRLESRDVLQSCLLKAFESIDELDGAGAGPFMAWFASIVEHEIRDQARYHHRQRRDARRDVPLDEAPERTARLRSALSELILDEQARRLEGAIERLADRYREIILLRKVEQRPWSEIARRLGKSEDACRMLLARAMTALTLEWDATA